MSCKIGSLPDFRRFLAYTFPLPPCGVGYSRIYNIQLHPTEWTALAIKRYLR